MALDTPLNLTFTQASPIQQDKLKSTEPSLEEQLAQLKKERDEQLARAEAHKKDLDATRKKLAEKEAQAKELHIENQRLNAENEETQRRQDLLVAELEKAEAQAELIKEMLLDEDQQQRLENVQKQTEQKDSE